MEQPAFSDKAHEPTDSDLAGVLGPAKRHWDALVAHARGASPAATAGWKFYSGKSGWTFVIREKKRNLLYLKPLAKRFTASMAFGDEAVDAAERSDLPAAVVKPIRASPKYPEGRAVRVEVATARELAVAGKLFDIKLAN